MPDLLQRIDKAIAARRLLGPGQPVLVAVSGGVDSMVLLRLLDRLAGRRRWHLAVAHFNHLLRGSNSQADQALVEKTARQLGLEFHRGQGEVRQFGRQKKISIEMAGRELRHKFLAETARRLGIKTIALGHHAGDQVELFFLRLLRGSGAALAGMKWAGPSPADPSIRLVRPLLGVTRAEIERFARTHQIGFREDPSNFRRDYLRNRIRHELLPLLRQIEPGADRCVLHSMEFLRDQADWIGEMSLGWKGRLFEELPRALQRQIISRNLIEAGIEPSFRLLERLRLASGKLAPAGKSGGFVLRDSKGRIERRSIQSFSAERCAVGLARVRGRVTFGGLEIVWERSKAASRDGCRVKAGCERFDAGKVGGKIILRHWQPGDRFQPIGLRAPAKLQDLFVNQKIPRAQRSGLVLATTAAGEVFWVEQLRMSEGFKLDKTTRAVLKWHWRRGGPALARHD